jgi:hypothetical protein
MLRIPAGILPGLNFLPSARRPWILSLARPGSWLYIRLLGILRVEVRNPEILLRLYREMQEGRARFIVAFRHPSTDDPAVVFRALCGEAGKAARRLGLRLRRPPRAHFLYGRDVPEWGPHWFRWFLPRIGAISIFPGRGNAASFSFVRRTLWDSPHPVAMAPEGQVTYHVGVVPPLEHGTAQMAFWCMEDLARQGRTEEVFVLPVRQSYQFQPAGWPGVGRLLDRIEAACGLPPLAGQPLERPWERVMRAGRHLVATAEAYYARLHPDLFRRAEAGDDAEGLGRRIAAIVEAALAIAERALGCNPHGSWMNRVQALRYAGLGRIHRSDIRDADRLPPLPRALAERAAAEAWLALRHMELVDLAEYFRADYLAPESDLDRYAEVTGNLWDFVNRLQGGNIGGRIPVGPRIARATICEPIPVARFLEAYEENHRSGVARLTEAIHRTFQGKEGAQPAPHAHGPRAAGTASADRGEDLLLQEPDRQA